MAELNTIGLTLLAALVYWPLVYIASALWRRRKQRIESRNQLYYVLSTQEAYGDHILFWKPDGKGYTFDASEAGRYTWEQTRSMRQTDMPIPVETVDGILRPALFLEDLRDHACFSVGPKPLIPNCAHVTSNPARSDTWDDDFDDDDFDDDDFDDDYFDDDM